MRIKKPAVKLWWKTGDTGVVSSVEEQTEQAAALARIDGQELLVDPRTNPAVRPYADSLRNEQHREILAAEDRRVHRRIRVEDRRAAHAELGLEALQEANDTASPAHSVIALHKGRIRFMGASLAASITLSVGSAMGVEHLAEKWDAPKGSGYIAEVGLVGLATAVILYRSHLTRHGGTPSRFQDIILGAFMVVPLLASMAANIAGSGPVGVACSAGAAAFGLFSHIVADASATALQTQAERVTGDEEHDLRKTASGEDLFSAPAKEASASNLNPPIRFQVPGSWFVPQKVQVRAEVQVPEVHQGEVREPQAVQLPEPAEVHQPDNEPRTLNHAPLNLEPANPEPEVQNHPAEPVNPEPEPLPEPARTTRTTNLGDRAKRKAEEIEQVADLIRERGEKAVTLKVVRDTFGFAKTTGFHRLVAARELVQQETAVAS